MKTNRILFAITLISSPLLLNAYREGTARGQARESRSTRTDDNRQHRTGAAVVGAAAVAPVLGVGRRHVRREERREGRYERRDARRG